MSLPVTILERRPFTVYQDTVYEQTVIVEATNGQRFGLFDDDMLVDEDLVGSEAQISVSLLPKSKKIQTVEQRQKRIEPNPKSPLDFDNHEFYGELELLEENSEETYKAEVDVGVGTVQLYPFKAYNDHLSPGQTLRINAGRSDVSSVDGVL